MRCNCSIEYATYADWVVFYNKLEFNNIVQESKLLQRSQICINCGRIKETDKIKIEKDVIYFGKFSELEDNSIVKAKYFFNKFRNHAHVTYKTAIKAFRGNHIEIITKFWEKGYIKIHRKRIKPQFTLNSEIFEFRFSDIHNFLFDNNYEIMRISLLDNSYEKISAIFQFDIEQEILQKSINLFRLSGILLKTMQNERSTYLFNFLKIIHENIKKRKIKTLELSKDKHLNFDLSSGYFIDCINLLIILTEQINLDKFIEYDEILKKIKIKKGRMNYLIKQLENLFGFDLVYFNLYRKDPPNVQNLVPNIPLRVQHILSQFEINLRTFFIGKILGNSLKDSKSYFPTDLFKRLKQSALKEMKRSGIQKTRIDALHTSKFDNIIDLNWLFQEMSNSNYIRLIDFNTEFQSYFIPMNYDNDFRQKIGPLRNIVAHLKSDANRELSSHLEIFFMYSKRLGFFRL